MHGISLSFFFLSLPPSFPSFFSPLLSLCVSFKDKNKIYFQETTATCVLLGTQLQEVFVLLLFYFVCLFLRLRNVNQQAMCLVTNDRSSQSQLYEFLGAGIIKFLTEWLKTRTKCFPTGVSGCGQGGGSSLLCQAWGAPGVAWLVTAKPSHGTVFILGVLSWSISLPLQFLQGCQTHWINAQTYSSVSSSLPHPPATNTSPNKVTG